MPQIADYRPVQDKCAIEKAIKDLKENSFTYTNLKHPPEVFLEEVFDEDIAIVVDNDDDTDSEYFHFVSDRILAYIEGYVDSYKKNG